MRWDVFIWAAFALLLIAAEVLAPGAFMLWLGMAAAVVFLLVWLLPGIPLLLQVAAFVVLSIVSIQIYRRWFRKREPQSDRPALNRRTAALIGVGGCRLQMRSGMLPAPICRLGRRSKWWVATP